MDILLFIHHREERSSCFLDRPRHGALEKCYNMFACHRRTSNEKFIDGVTGLDVNAQGFHGHARALETLGLHT